MGKRGRQRRRRFVAQGFLDRHRLAAGGAQDDGCAHTHEQHNGGSANPERRLFLAGVCLSLPVWWGADQAPLREAQSNHQRRIGRQVLLAEADLVSGRSYGSAASLNFRVPQGGSGGRVAQTHQAGGNGIFVAVRQRLPDDYVLIVDPPHQPPQAVGQAKRAADVAGWLKMPGNAQRVASADLKLTRLIPRRQRPAINSPDNIGNAVCILSGQLPEYVSKWFTVEIKNDRFGYQQGTICLYDRFHVKAVSVVRFG